MKSLKQIKNWLTEISILISFIIMCLLLIIFCNDLEREMRMRTS